MNIRFFNREVENPVLKVLIGIGAAVFAVALVAAILAILIPVLGAILTGVLLIVAVVLLLLLVFLPFIAFLGVIFSGGRKGSGTIRSETRTVEPFDSVKISGRAEVYVKCGEEQSVTVSTDDNLLDCVETEVSDGEFSVSFSKPVSHSSSFRVDLVLKELRRLRVFGASKVFLENMQTEQLSLRVSGAAEVKGSGNVHTFKLRISGAGKASAGDLVSQVAEVRISGAGSARIHAEEKLSVKISGAGRVTCSGNPETVEKHISGAGRVELL